MLSAYARALSIALLMALSVLATSARAVLPADTLRVHYHREAGDYDGWGLHVWGEIALQRTVSWGRPLAMSGQDSFGIYFDVPLIPGSQHVGFILHQGNQKNVRQDMSINPQVQGYEVWQLEGDGVLYASRGAAAAALPAVASEAPARPDPKLEQMEAQRDARDKAAMLALAREAAKPAPTPAHSQASDTASLKAKEEQARLQVERDKLLQQLIAQRDERNRQAQQQLFQQKQAAMMADMRRRAEILARQAPHRQRVEQMNPMVLIGLWLGGGCVLIVIGVLILIRRTRRLPVTTSLLETTQMPRDRSNW